MENIQGLFKLNFQSDHSLREPLQYNGQLPEILKKPEYVKSVSFQHYRNLKLWEIMGGRAYFIYEIGHALEGGLASVSYQLAFENPF